MKIDLINFGIVPNKTKVGLNINIDFIPDLYFYDFLRGFFDGDGCICHRKIKNTKYKITRITCSDKNFLIKIKNRINLQSNIISEKTYYNLIYYNGSSLCLRNLLYKMLKKAFV